MKKVGVAPLENAATETPSTTSSSAGLELKPGDRDQIDMFASRFGMAMTAAPTDPSTITHNLRTAIVDADGKLVKVYTGPDWKPEQVVTDLEALK